MAAIAVSLDIYDKTKSPTWLAVTMLGAFGVSGVLSPFAGYVVDRYDRKAIMVVTAMVTASLWALLAGVESTLWLIALVTVANLVEVPYGVAANAAVPNFVDEDELAWANSWFMSGYNFGKLIGPALGAVIYAMAGSTVVYGINAVSFVFAGVLVLTIRQAFSKDHLGGGQDTTASEDQRAEKTQLTFFSGFRECFRDPVILRLLMLTLTACIAINASLVTDVFLVKDFHAGPTAFGLLGATFGLGYLAGSLLAGRVKARREWPWIIWGAVALTAGWAVVAVTPWFALVFVAVFGAALMDSVSGVLAYALVQRRIEDRIRGRVLSVFSAVATLANIVGFGLAGLTMDALGSQGVYGLGAGICLLALIAVLTYRGDPYEPQPEPVEMVGTADTSPNRAS